MESVRTIGHAPNHRLYGKLLLTGAGHKIYLAATQADISAYDECSRLLGMEVKRKEFRLPTDTLADGFNTRQAIGYNYKAWRDFFNDRQLLALGWLQEAIAELSDASVRDPLLTLFSGIIEFNNLFASYKGEGTGAVRHMFAHHILKPERTPIEANVWGTPKSSGSFSNLFKTRLLRAIEYRESPFEAANRKSGKTYLTNVCFTGQIDPWPKDDNFRDHAIYLSCGSSDATGLPDKCVDFVVTDPPFFDNVHYSELADFFYAWQRLYPRGLLNGAITTRHPKEVQDTSAVSFAQKLCAVFTECHRLLRDDGLLVFTYHHSRQEGWTSLTAAIYDAGFSVVNAHPVKSEMAVAAPKSQAKEPIQIDIIIVCKKQKGAGRNNLVPEEAFRLAVSKAQTKISRLLSAGLRLSLNDRRVVVNSQFLASFGDMASSDVAVRAFLDCENMLGESAAELGRNMTQPISQGQSLLPFSK